MDDRDFNVLNHLISDDVYVHIPTSHDGSIMCFKGELFKNLNNEFGIYVRGMHLRQLVFRQKDIDQVQVTIRLKGMVLR